MEDAVTIELQTILHDNRCPSQVQCYAAGEAEIAINASSLNDLEPTRFELNTNPPLHQDTVLYDAYEIRLVAVNPYPETLHQVIPLRDYIITFVVSSKPE